MKVFFLPLHPDWEKFCIVSKDLLPLYAPILSVPPLPTITAYQQPLFHALLFIVCGDSPAKMWAFGGGKAICFVLELSEPSTGPDT